MSERPAVRWIGDAQARSHARFLRIMNRHVRTRICNACTDQQSQLYEAVIATLERIMSEGLPNTRSRTASRSDRCEHFRAKPGAPPSVHIDRMCAPTTNCLCALRCSCFSG